MERNFKVRVMDTQQFIFITHYSHTLDQGIDMSILLEEISSKISTPQEDLIITDIEFY